MEKIGDQWWLIYPAQEFRIWLPWISMEGFSNYPSRFVQILAVDG